MLRAFRFGSVVRLAESPGPPLQSVANRDESTDPETIPMRPASHSYSSPVRCDYRLHPFGE